MTDKKLLTFSAKELQAAKPAPPEFVVEALLPVGLTAFGGPPKFGKSWLSLDLAEAVATGRTFWGRKTTGGDVLYLALEDSGSRIYNRLTILESTFPESLRFAIRGAASLRQGLIDQLNEWVRSVSRPKLIIVDTVGRIKDIVKTDAYTADSILYGPLQEFAQKNNVAVLALTHLTKKTIGLEEDPFSRIQGSVGLFAVADAGWIMTGKREEHEKTFYITGRDLENDSFKIRFNQCRWSMLGATVEYEEIQRVELFKNSPIRKTILKLTEQSGQWTGSTTELLSQIQQITGYNALNLNTVGRSITQNKVYFDKIDQISMSQADGGAHGRNYTFIKMR